MRTFTHPAFAFVSAALAACCLLAGHARRAAVHITRAARPAAQTSALLQGAGKTFGAAVKLGPIFVGTDYMFFGKNTKNVNAYIGFSIPLNKQKS